MNQRLVVAAFEVGLRGIPETRIQDHLDAVNRSQWRDRSGLAVLEELNQLALSRQAKVTLGFLAYCREIESMAGRNDRHQITIIVSQHDALHQLVAGDVSGLRAVGAVPGSGVGDG